jgi:basic amino acid/polyamine antiporter, APA family
MGEKGELKRDLGLLEVTFSGLGIILGAGIYSLIGEASGMAGNAVWLSFGLAALVALFTGLSYAELSSMFPKASAEYEYTSQAFGKKVAFVIGWLIIFSGVIGAATVALGFAGYLQAIANTPIMPMAIVLIAASSAVLFVGVKQSAWVAIAFTLIEASGLAAIIAIGIPYFGSVNYLEMPFGISGVLKATALIFFAFIGFEEIVKLSEETKNPEKNIPKGLVLSVAASIVLYILVALSAVGVLGWEKLSQSSAPFADIAFEAFGENASLILSVIALFATANTVLLMLLAASRITYGMAERNSLPAFLTRVHQRTKTPWAAILAIMALSMVFLLLGDIGFIANVTNFTLFLTFIFINAALVILRFRKPEISRPFKVPLSIGRMPLIPIAGLASCAFMIAQLSTKAITIGIALALAGVLFSLFYASKQKHLKI